MTRNFYKLKPNSRSHCCCSCMGCCTGRWQCWSIADMVAEEDDELDWPVSFWTKALKSLGSMWITSGGCEYIMTGGCLWCWCWCCLFKGCLLLQTEVEVAEEVEDFLKELWESLWTSEWGGRLLHNAWWCWWWTLKFKKQKKTATERIKFHYYR